MKFSGPVLVGAVVLFAACASNGSSAVDSGGGSGGGGSGSGGAIGSGGQRPIEAGGGGAIVQADAAPPPPSDGAVDEGTAAPDSGAKPSRALLYALSNGGHLLHPSIGPAEMALQDALTPLGFTVDISVDPTKFSATGLQDYAVVVLIDSSGMPFGTPGTDGMNALQSFVRGGGGLVGIHSASLLDYDATSTIVTLLGGKFSGHPGGLRASTCQSEGTHPAVVDLPKPYMTTDEFYTFVAMNADDQIDLRCAGAGGVLPIAWHRTEGNGRVYYTGLGHDPTTWGAATTLVKAHVLPAILWAAGR